MPGAGNAAPVELQPLVPLQSAVSKLAAGKASTLADASQEYERLMGPNVQAPAPPVYAARLSGLLKSLASAEGAVAESIKARRELIDGLAKMLEKNRNMLQTEENEAAEISERKAGVETKKRDVEDGIIRGLAEEGSASAGDANGNAGGDDGTHQGIHNAASAEPEAPMVEALTPPPVESLSPPGRPPGTSQPNAATNTTSENPVELDDEDNADYEPPAVFPAPPISHLQQHPAPALPGSFPASTDMIPGLGMGAAPSTFNYHAAAQNGAEDGSSGSSAKKRKLAHRDAGEGEFVDLGTGDAMDGLDDDVAEMLRRDTGRLS